MRIAFDSLDPRILPDMGAKVALLAGAGPGAAVVVPKEAVREVEGKKVVFVLRDGKVERRVVKVGTAKGNETEILSGVAAGEQVLTRSPRTLRDGERAEKKTGPR